MAITVPNDIVLGVARAADPAAYEAAVARLTALKSSAPTPSTDKSAAPASFAETIAAANTAALPASTSGTLSLAASTAPVNVRAQSDKAAEPFKQFESFVLQTFIEAMLPDDAESVYGGGIAGQYWKSMMAEKLAGELADNGGIGIARQLSADAAKARARDGAQASPTIDKT